MTKDITTVGVWPQFNTRFPFPALFWGSTVSPMAHVMNIPLLQTAGSTSVLGQPDSLSVQARGKEDSVVDNLN